MPYHPAATTVALLLLAASAAAGGARADEIVRHPLPNSDLPILSAVEIPPPPLAAWRPTATPGRKRSAR